MFQGIKSMLKIVISTFLIDIYLLLYTVLFNSVDYCYFE